MLIFANIANATQNMTSTTEKIEYAILDDFSKLAIPATQKDNGIKNKIK
jgi:hypothetical protein